MSSSACLTMKVFTLQAALKRSLSLLEGLWCCIEENMILKNSQILQCLAAHSGPGSSWGKGHRRKQSQGLPKNPGLGRRQTQREHVMDVEWLQEQIGLIRKEPNGDKRRIIAVTHHAPSTQQTSKPSDINNPWTSAFASDLIGLKDTPVLSEVQWWIFGHTHYSTHFTKDGVKVVSNQRGYSLPQITDHTAPTAIRKSFGSDLITSISGGLISRRGQNQSAFDGQKIINV